MDKLNEEWKDRIAKAKQWLEGYKANYINNVKLYNSRKRNSTGKKTEYYSNLLWQVYKTEKATIIPSSINYYVEIENNPADYNLNMMASEMLNNILASNRNILLTEKLHLQAICKGMGVAMIYVEEGKEIASEIGNKKKIQEKKKELKLKIFKTEDFLYDKDLNVDCLEDLLWMAVPFYITISEFRKGDYLNKTDILKANGIKEKYSEDEIQNEFKQIKIWEIWDTLNRKKYFIEDKSFLFIKPEEDYPIENPNFNHPFVFLTFTEGDSDDYPLPAEIDIIKQLQDDYNEIKSGQKRDAKRMFRKFFALEGSISKTEEDKLLNLDRDQIIKVNSKSYFSIGQTHDITKIVMPAPENPTPPQVDMLLASIRSDLRESTGYGPSERGNMPIVQTATEANIIRQYLSERTQKKMEKIFHFWENLGQKAFMIIEELFPDEINVKIAKYGNVAIWKKMNLKELKGKDKSIKVYAGTKGMINKQSIITENLQTANLLFPLAQNYNLDLSNLIRKILILQEWTPEEIEYLFRGQREKAKAIAYALLQYSQGGMDEMEAMKFMGLISDFLQSYLSPNEIAEIQGKFAQTGGKPPAKQTTSGLPSQRISKLAEDINKGIL